MRPLEIPLAGWAWNSNVVAHRKIEIRRGRLVELPAVGMLWALFWLVRQERFGEVMSPNFGDLLAVSWFWKARPQAARPGSSGQPPSNHLNGHNRSSSDAILKKY
jgi:hypothetical protein